MPGRQPDGPMRRGDDQHDGVRDRQFVTALARGLEILRCFRPGRRLLGNGELAARTGLPKPTVSRLTHTLTCLGYLRHLPAQGKYELDHAVLSLGYAVLANLPIRHIARPLMQDLADYANCSVSLAARDRLEMIYLESCRSRSTVSLRLDAGLHMPMLSTSIGRAFLAALPEPERDYFHRQLRERDPAEWRSQQPTLAQSLLDYRECGYCLSLGDWKRNVHGVAAPLLMPDDSDVLVVTVSGPAFSLRRRQLVEDIGPRLLYLVRHLQEEVQRELCREAGPTWLLPDPDPQRDLP